MKNDFIRLIATVCFITFTYFANGQQQTRNDWIVNYLDGKKFYALLGESCAETTNGDYMYSEHCVLIFNKNKVSVKHYSNRDRSYKLKEEPKTEEAVYIIKNDTIVVEGLKYLPLIADIPKTPNDIQLRIYTPFDYFHPDRKHIYFTELSKGVKTFIAQSP